jgi:parallel beta-helix repeat protein
VVTVDDGEIDIARCRFSGGIWSDAEKRGGDGLLLRGNTTGSIRGSRFEENELSGMELQDQSQPLLEDNVFKDNGKSGLIYFENSGGTARRNELTGNGLHGIEVRKQAKPTLEDNICSKNVQDGIAYFENAAGEASKNTCSENGLHGIGVSEEAHPTLEDNTCENNAETGIRFADSSGGTARGNRCTGNGLHGFHLGEQANPTLEDNISNHNVEGGFVYFDESSGVARGNACIGNRWGIHVVETASPELVNNDCRENSKADIDDRRVSPEPGFGPITFARGRTEENAPIDPATIFPAGVTEIHALFDFEGMSAGVAWSRTWYRDGEERVAKTQNWTGDERGTWGGRYYNTDGSPLKSGNYELRVYIAGSLVQSGTFVIEP